MRLKEIKPGMVITCTHREEVIELWDYLNKNHGTPNDDEYGIDEMLKCYMEGYHFKINGDEWEEVTDGGIPYAALLLPELSADEVLTIISEMCINTSCKECYLGEFCDHTNSACSLCSMDPSVIIDACVKWKSEHEKKEPEIEWFWQGRIFQIYEDGGYYQIKDGAGFYDTRCEYRESAEEYMADTLKEYCKSHEGIYIATVEHVCRVKAVE